MAEKGIDLKKKKQQKSAKKGSQEVVEPVDDFSDEDGSDGELMVCFLHSPSQITNKRLTFY